MGGELLTQTEDIVRPWKEHFEDLNPVSMSSIEEAKSKDLGEDSYITLAEVVEIVKKLPGFKAPGVDEICTEMLKALEIVELSWLMRLFSVWDDAHGVADQGGGSHF